MKIAFTLCSLNYLAQAKTLADSLTEHNPDWHFVIGLVDRINDRISDSYWKPYELIEVEKIGIEELPEMQAKYDIVELNTSVKPFYMDYLFARDENVEIVAYFDPDICMFGSLKDLNEKIKLKPIVLTPHFFKPAPEDRFLELEQLCLWVGVYNLGFIALHRSVVTSKFLDWWKARLKKFCFRNLSDKPEYRGLFVDQAWIDFVPVFFSVPELLHEGHNVAYWNLMEREISKNQDGFFINNENTLVFFHFSSYNPLTPDTLAKYWDKQFSFERYPQLQELFDIYRKKLLDNEYTRLSEMPCLLVREIPVPEKKIKYKKNFFGEIKRRVKVVLNKFTE